MRVRTGTVRGRNMIDVDRESGTADSILSVVTTSASVSVGSRLGNRWLHSVSPPCSPTTQQTTQAALRPADAVPPFTLMTCRGCRLVAPLLTATLHTCHSELPTRSRISDAETPGAELFVTTTWDRPCETHTRNRLGSARFPPGVRPETVPFVQIPRRAVTVGSDELGRCAQTPSVR